MIFKKYFVKTLIIIILYLLLSLSENKCKNSTDFRYELRQIAEIQGYNSVCYQFTRRTCCSPKNIDVLARKISKSLIGSVQQLSIGCKGKITQLMCSYCDGDIGQGSKQGVCKSYCQQLYEVCKEDYFIIDTNNKLRVCKEEDILCSQLKFIVKDSQKQPICQLFGVSQRSLGCWNGENSADVYGKAKRKIKYHYKRKIPGRQSQDNDNEIVKIYAIGLMLGIFGALIFWKWGKNLFLRKPKYYRLD